MANLWEDEPIALLLGHVDHEGVSSHLSQTGRFYKKKILHSKPNNWREILRLFSCYSVTVALAKLTTDTYSLIARKEYGEVTNTLFEQLSSVPHALFIHEGVFTGETDHEWSEHFTYPSEQTRNKVNELISKYALNVITYQKNAEVTVLATEFLNQTESGLLMRLYVPAGQLWANETDKVLQLFKDYLTRIASVDVRLDEKRTQSGVIYELFGDKTDPRDLSTEFNEFSELMTLCASDPDRAEIILRDKLVEEGSIIQIMTKYAKEARRLAVDMKHEREQKVMGIRHRLESELLDTIPSDVELQSIFSLVDAAVPKIDGPKTLMAPGISNSTAFQSLTLNVNPQFIEQMNGIVAQEISGDLNFNENDKELLRLFELYAGAKQSELISALRELKDESAPRQGRLSAKQKIKTFLLGIGSSVKDIGTGLLQTYIETLFGL